MKSWSKSGSQDRKVSTGNGNGYLGRETAKGFEVDASHVAIGRIVKAQGLNGQLKVSIYSGDPDELLPFQLIYLGHNADFKTFTLKSSRSQGKFAVISLAEIVDRDGAEAHAGQEVWVLKSQMPALPSDEFYWHEMVGLTVRTLLGQELGRVTSLIATRAHDVMVVTSLDQREYLIPAVQEILVSQDTEAGLLVIDPPPGLLEINSLDAI